MSKTAMRITESDEAGNVLATYVPSPGGQDRLSRVDVIVSLSRRASIYLL